MPIVLGVDEAGRGAVLGPLVVAGVWAEEERLAVLAQAGARDSKQVPRSKRLALLRTLFPQWEAARVVVIPPTAIDQENLTALELHAMRRLLEHRRPDQVVLDAPVAPRALPKFLDRLAREARFPRARLHAYPKADRLHPAVSAASLLAKVVRDGHMALLQQRYGPVGWGYPGEPAVRAFLARWLEEHGAPPPICRTRWKNVVGLAFTGLWGGGPVANCAHRKENRASE